MSHLPAAATTRLRDRLASAPDGPLGVLHRGPLAVYLTVETLDGTPWALGVLAAGAARVPNGLRTALPHLADLDVGSARLESGELRLGRASLSSAVASVVPGSVWQGGGGRQGGALATDDNVVQTPLGRRAAGHGIGRHALSEEVVRVTRLVDATVRPVPAAPGGALDDVLAEIGRGDGLTPYGDDVACGWLATRYAAGLSLPAEQVRAAGRRTTLLSATLLDCALHGEVLPELAAWLAGRGAAEESALIAVGASSGRGLLAGARLALGVEAAAA